MGIVVRKPSQEELKALGVFNWPVWSCPPSTFDWSYSEKETCFLLEGRVTVKTPEGEVEMGSGDLVVFPTGLSCTWKVLEKVRKHYNFG
jgi:uncharacterized cupin superfamily protein